MHSVFQSLRWSLPSTRGPLCFNHLLHTLFLSRLHADPQPHELCQSEGKCENNRNLQRPCCGRNPYWHPGTESIGHDSDRALEKLSSAEFGGCLRHCSLPWWTVWYRLATTGLSTFLFPCVTIPPFLNPQTSQCCPAFFFTNNNYLHCLSFSSLMNSITPCYL